MLGLNVFLAPRTGFDKPFTGYAQPFDANSVRPQDRAGALLDATPTVKPGFTLTGRAFPAGWWHAPNHYAVAPSSMSGMSRRGAAPLVYSIAPSAERLPQQIVRAGNGSVIVVR